MTIENDFLPFATGGGANVLSQSAYAALSAVSTGYQSGVAQSAALNKTWRQSSIMAAVMASFIVQETGQPAIDDGTTATLLTNFTTAVVAASKQRVILTDTGAANAYAAANAVPMVALPTASGVVQTVQIAHTNTGASTYAPDGLATKPIFGLGGAALQGNELPANGIATLVSFVSPLLNGGNLCWVLYECVGGAQQISPATASQHAVQLGQIQTQSGTAFTTAGTAPAFTLTPSPAITAYAANQRFRVKFNATGTTGSNTLNISGQGAVALMQFGAGGVLQNAVIQNGLLSDVEYNGSSMIVLDPVASRTVLTANLNLYVATTGSDTANTGLSSGSPFLTLQKAYNYLQQNYDLGGQYTATINVATGTYTAGLQANGPIIGALNGPGSVIVNGVGAGTNIDPPGASTCFGAANGAQYGISNCSIQSSGSGSNGVVTNDATSRIQIGSGIVFGGMAAGAHILCTGGMVSVLAGYTIAGGAGTHVFASNTGALVTYVASTMTLTGTPAFTNFAVADYLGQVNIAGMTFSGSATGARYNIAGNSLVYTGGAATTYLPGSTAGSASLGGLYA